MIAFSDPSQAPGQSHTRYPPPTQAHNPGNDRIDGNPRTRANPDTEAIGDEIARLSAHLNAATYQLLVLIRDFDQREGWANGFLSCAHWLAWRTGISPRPAREKVRVARALAPLTLISQAMAKGTLSYSKVRAMTRVATPENEGDLLDVARHATAAQLEKLVRAWRRVEDLNDPGKEEQRHERRFLRLHQDEDGSYVIQGRLDPEVGALVERALEWANEALYQEDSETAFQHRMADGLGLVAQRALAADGDRATDGAQGADGALDGDRAAEGALAVDGDRAVGGAFAVDGARASDRPLASSKPEGKPRPVSRADRFQVVVHVGADELRGPLPPGTGRGSGEPGDAEACESALRVVAAGGSAEPQASRVARPESGLESAPESGPASGGSAEPGRSLRQGSGSGPDPAVGSGSPGTLEFLSPETSRRLSCDAGLVIMTHDADGRVLDVGRKSRTVPPSLRRALDARDKGCRFPGCQCRYTEAHHIRHWAQGGETRLDNLLLLCSRHHRALHEGGFQIRRVAGEGELQIRRPAGGDSFQFLSPTGRAIPEVPASPPIQGDPVREMVARNADAGVVPDAWTATPLWNGDRLDLSLAVDMFMGLTHTDLAT